MPITAAPSIWLRMRSGFAAKPQSMAMWTSGTRISPSTIFTRTAAAT